MKGFQHSFDLDPDSSSYANLSGNIVSVLQGGCFFGAAASFWLSDKMLVSSHEFMYIHAYIKTGRSLKYRVLHNTAAVNGLLSWPISSSSWALSYKPAVPLALRALPSSTLADSSAALVLVSSAPSSRRISERMQTEKFVDVASDGKITPHTYEYVLDVPVR